MSIYLGVLLAFIMGIAWSEYLEVCKPKPSYRTIAWGICVALLLLIASSAHAEPTTGGPLYAGFVNKKRVTLDITCVTNPWLRAGGCRQIQSDAVEFYRSSGIRLIAGKILHVGDPFESFSGGRLYPEHFEHPALTEGLYWGSRFNRKVKPWHVNYVVSPPWMYGGQGEWRDGAKPQFAGFAQQGWVRRGCVAQGTGMTFNVGGGLAIVETLLVALQEVGHCLGGEHDNSEPNVMSEDNGTVRSFTLLASTVGQMAGVLR